MSSGEALSAETTEIFYQRMKAGLQNLYGPTEAAVDVTYWRCREGERGVVPIGGPIANTQIYILDEEMRAVPVGVKGELYIGGGGLAGGKVNGGEWTGEGFGRT